MAHGARGYALFSGGEHGEAAREITASLELLSPSSVLRSIPVVQGAALDLARGRAAAALSAIQPVLEEEGGSAPPYPGACFHAWAIEVDALEALGSRPRARAALAKARRRLLATASKLADPALSAIFLQAAPWASPLFARSAQALDHDDSLRELRSAG